MRIWLMTAYWRFIRISFNKFNNLPLVKELMSEIRLFAILLMLLAGSVISVAQPEGINKTDGKGRKQGYWKKYSGDTLKYEGHFVNDKPEGEFKYYYPGGKIKTVMLYSDSGRAAYAVAYSPAGKKISEGAYYDKKRDGIWKYYNSYDVRIAQEVYLRGIRNGEWKTYYEDGKINELITWKNDVMDGPWLQYYPDSVLKMKGSYLGGKQNGKTEYFYTTGTLLVSGEYQSGERNGVWTYFHESGAPERKISFDKGTAYKEEIVFLSGNTLKTTDIYTIAWVGIQQGKALVTMNNGEQFPSNKTMDEMERMLNENYFFRVNKEYIISNWCIANKANYSDQARKLELKPAAASAVIVSAEKNDSFMFWSGIKKHTGE